MPPGQRSSDKPNEGGVKDEFKDDLLTYGRNKLNTIEVWMATIKNKIKEETL